MTTSDFINLPPSKRRALFLKAAKRANAMQRKLVREADRMICSPQKGKGRKRKE